MGKRNDDQAVKQADMKPNQHSRRHLSAPVVKAKHTKETLLRIWNYLRNQRIALILVVLFTAMSAILMLMGPYLIGKSIDQYIIPRDYNGLITLCFVLLAVYVGSSLFSWLQMHVMAAVSQDTVRHMRKDIFSKIQKLPIAYFDKTPHGEVMSRTTNDMETVSNTLNQSLAQFINSILTLVGVITFMLIMNVWLTLISLIIIPLVIFTTKFIAGFTRKFFRKQQKELGALNSYIEETVSGQKVIQVYRREERALADFKEKNTNLRQVAKHAQVFAGIMGPTMNFVNHLSFILIASIGGYMALKELATIGVVVAFLNYSKQFSRPINELASQFNMLQSAIAGAERIFEVMDEEAESDEEMQLPILQTIENDIVFDDVSFRYKRDEPVIDHMSFTAKKGQRIALVGPTGAGKSTIIHLITRFYDVTDGAIKIDGVDIRDYDKNSLRKKIGMVLQDTFLFQGTIMDNLKYGKLDATDEEVKRAAEMAHAASFIGKLPHGYETRLSTNGENLSQGQRQLLAIARAILADPEMLILDEATSSIDTRTEKQVQMAMNSLMKGRTSFVIAHRLSTIREADKILVIQDGQIAEQGSHQQLMVEKGFYYDLQMNVGKAIS